MREVARHNQPVVAHERFARSAHALLAVGGQRDVRRPCVAPVQGPFCFAVADDEDARVGHGGGLGVDWRAQLQGGRKRKGEEIEDLAATGLKGLLMIIYGKLHRVWYAASALPGFPPYV